jgi:hypothetical protein
MPEAIGGLPDGGAIRGALREVERAESILSGSQVKPPRKVNDRASVSQGDFDHSLCDGRRRSSK